MRRGLVLLVLAMLCLLAGCTAWMGGSYASVTPHAEGYAQTEPVDTAVASSQSELISVLARLVKNHTDQASVDVSQYEGDLEKELDLAVLEVMETDPVVAYAAEDIRLQQAEVGVRQMVSVEITYSRTQEELQAIQTAWGESGMKSKVTAALERVEPAITLQVTNYQPVNLDLFVRTYYENHLETIMECPQVVVQVYPEQGSERVVEIQFLYSASQETLLQMRQEVQVLLNSAAGYVEGQTSEEIKANRLYAFLRPLFVQSRPSETPVYSLLCVGTGDSRSVAMVYGLLCRRVGLDCQVVSGTSNGREWYWNILRLDGTYYHVDVLSDLETGTLRTRYDEDMEGYVWNTKSCPSCPKPLPPATEETAPPETEETQESRPAEESTAPEEETTEPEETPGE